MSQPKSQPRSQPKSQQSEGAGTTYADAVSGWADHLVGGGRTTWSAWEPMATPPSSTPPSSSRPLPDATHLELLRTMNERAGEPLPGLAAALLDTPLPGRGRVDVPLPWAGPGRPRFGQPPIEPTLLPAEELLRLAVGLLARLLPGVTPPPPEPELARWPMPWRRRFRLHGSPGTVAGVRRQLVAQGLVETDWRPVHVVLGRSLEVMMAEHWTASALAGGQLRWGTLWRRTQTTGPPGQLDVISTAARLAAAPDRRREPVHLVLARDADEVAAQVAAILRTRPFDLVAPTDAAQVDLLRRLNRLTAVAHGPARVRRLATTLAALLEDSAGHDREPVVPTSALQWAEPWSDGAVDRARAAAEDPGSAGYSVHGAPEALAPGTDGQGSIDPQHTLAVAVEGCLRAWRRQEGAT